MVLPNSTQMYFEPSLAVWLSMTLPSNSCAATCLWRRGRGGGR